MFGTRIRKIASDIQSRKVRTLLVSISIFIGVFGTVTMFTMGDLLVRQLEKDIDSDKLAMVRVTLAPNPGAEVDNDQLLAVLRNQPQITIAEGQAVYPLTWKTETQQDFQSATLFAYSEPFNGIQLEPMYLEQGVYPKPGHHEIAVERRFAQSHELGIGDALILEVANSSGDVSEETWTIVGLVFFPYGYPGLNSLSPEESLFATYDDARHIVGFNGFSSIYVRYEDFESAQEQADRLASNIADEGSYVPLLTMITNPEKHSQIVFAQTISGVMTSLALLGLFASGFLVLNIVTSIITEQKNQVGILKAMGATRWDIIFIYAGIALTYGVLGVIPGVILGIPAGYLAAQAIAGVSNTAIDEFAFSWTGIVLGIGMGLLIPVLASLLPVFSATRIRIIEAITDRGISGQYGQGILAQIVQRLPLPLNIRQGVSNVVRKRGRIALTGLALTVAVGAFMGVFALLSGVDVMLDDQFGYYNHQFSIAPRNADDLAEIEALIRQQSGSLALRGPVVEVAITIDGFDKVFDPSTGPPALFAIGFDPAYQPYDLELAEGKSLSEVPEGVILSQTVADYLHKKTGDQVTIHAGGHSKEYTIAGVASFAADGVWFHWRTLASLAGFSDTAGNPVPTGLLVEVEAHDPGGAEVAKQIRDFDKLLKGSGITASYENIVLRSESITQTFVVFQVIFYFAALLIALVGGVGLLTALSMAVFERQKEIGVMRAVGADSKTIIIQFLSEGMFVGILAWLAGIPLSYGVYQGLLQAMNLGNDFQGFYSLQVVLMGLTGMILLTTLASISPSIVAARKTVSDILRYQ